jgi:hypothetical protein
MEGRRPRREARDSPEGALSHCVSLRASDSEVAQVRQDGRGKRNHSPRARGRQGDLDVPWRNPEGHGDNALHSGFNILRTSILTTIGKSSDLVLSHPPYHDMIPYSGSEWGGEGGTAQPLNRNLSEIGSVSHVNQIDNHNGRAIPSLVQDLLTWLRNAQADTSSISMAAVATGTQRSYPTSTTLTPRSRGFLCPGSAARPGLKTKK